MRNTNQETLAWLKAEQPDLKTPQKEGGTIRSHAMGLTLTDALLDQTLMPEILRPDGTPYGPQIGEFAL